MSKVGCSNRTRAARLVAYAVSQIIQINFGLTSNKFKPSKKGNKKMEITKEKLDIVEGLKREWLITNGIGGYSSSTIIGANTRKYHGLLVAPLTPPGRRYVILSKVDESIQINQQKYNLYTNVCKEYVADGFKYQQKFTKDYVPVFEYQVEDVQITKVFVWNMEKIRWEYIIK